MNPNREGAASNFEIPPAESLEGDDLVSEKGHERAPARPEQAGKQAPAPQLPAIPDDIPVADTPMISLPADDIAQQVSTAQQDDHKDHIEPIWVDKAKQVIAGTRDDPFQQKAKMSQIKAEYIQKRFNKQVKLEET